MTNDERAQLELLRVEVNGKLDVIIERISNMKLDGEKLEDRIRVLEDRVDKLNQKIYMAVGVIGFLAVVLSALANAWPFH